MSVKNGNFEKLFKYYVPILLVPIVVLGMVTVGIMFEKLAADEKEFNENIAEQAAASVDKEMEATLSFFYQLEKNDKLNNFIKKYSRHSVSNLDIYEVIEELKVLKGGSSAIKEAGVYFKGREYIITDSLGGTFSEFHETSELGSISSGLLKEYFEEKTLASRFIICEELEECSVICCKNLSISGSLNKITAFVIWNREVVLEKTKFIKKGKDVEFAVTDFDGKIVLKTPEFDFADLKNDKNVVSSKSEVMNCNYFFWFKDGITSGVRNMELFFALALFAALLASAGLAFLQKNRLRKALLNIFNQNISDEVLSAQLENTKEKILWNLLHNIHTLESNTGETALKYGIEFKKQRFSVMSVSCVNGTVVTDIEDAAWTQFSDIIVRELKNMDIECKVVKISKSTYSYILNYDVLPNQIKELPKIFHKKYDAAVGFGLGAEQKNIEKIHISYENSIYALKVGIKDKTDEIVFYDDVQMIEKKKLSYSQDKEKQLIRVIKLGVQENVNRILEEIYNENSVNGYSSQSIMKRLNCNIVMTVYKLLDELYVDNEDKYEKYSRVCQNILRNENQDECFEIIREMCASICGDIEKTENKGALKEKLVLYIEQNYMNSLLSMNDLAEHLGITYNYVSRIFKEALGVNFVGYLSLVRLEKARELLDSTDYTVDHIAKQCGYIDNNSLIRAFKKYYDITPGQYRKKK